MIPSLPPLVHRVLAWALLAVSIMTVWAGIVRPIQEHLTTMEQRIDIAASQVARLEDRLRQVPAVQVRVPGNLIYEGRSPPLATAALLSDLSGAVSDAGGATRASIGRDPEEVDGGHRVSVQLDADMDMETLATLLFDIETRRPLAEIDMLDITPARRSGTSPQDPVALSVRLQVSSLLAAEAPQ